MNPLRIFLLAALFVAILGTVSNDVEASLVEVYVNDVDLLTSEEDVTIGNETDLELIIRLKGDYRMESENDGMSVQSIWIDVSFLNDEDPRDSVLGYPEYQPLGDNESDPGYDEVRSLFRSNSTFEGYTGELGLSIIMKNRTGSIIWDGYFNIVMILKEKPDLYISELSFSNNNPEIGEEITINATIMLLGVNVTDNFSVGFYLDAIPSENGTEIGSQVVNGIEIWHQHFVSINWTAINGTHTIYVVVDSTDVIDESEEKNVYYNIITVGFVEPEPNETSETTDTTEETTSETEESDNELETDYTMTIIGAAIVIALSILGAAVILKR